MPITSLIWTRLSVASRVLASHRSARLHRTLMCLPLVIMAIAIAGCQPTLPPTGGRLPKITFAHKPPIRIAAEAIQKTVVLPARPVPDEIGDQFSPDLRDAFSIWVDSRFVANGAPGGFEVQLVRADLTRNVIAEAEGGGLSGLFKDRQYWKYTGKIQVRIARRLPGQATVHSFVEAEAEGFFTTSQNITLNMLALEKFNLVESLIGQIDAQVEESLPQFMGDIVR